MNKIKKLPTIVLAAALLLLGAGSLRPVFAAVYFDVSSQVSISTITTSPTLLLAPTNTPYAAVRLICTQLNVVGENVLLSSSATGFSTSVTTGTARLPCLPYTVQQLDFFIDDYTGPLYAVSNSTYPMNVSVWRKK